MSARALKDLGWFDFRAAAWWLGLLYRRPRHFREALEELPLESRDTAATVLAVHALAYAILIAAVGRWLVFGVLGGPPLEIYARAATGIVFGITSGITSGTANGIAIGIASGTANGIVIGITIGIASGTASGIASGTANGIAIGIASGTANGIVFGIASEFASEFAYGIATGIAPGIAIMAAYGGAYGGAIGIATGIVFGMTYGIVFGIAYGIAPRIATGIATGIAIVAAYGIASGTANGIVFGINAGVSFGIAIGITLLRAYYYPWHLILLAVTPTATGYRWHPAAWDDLCSLPFVGLNRFLLDLWNSLPESGEREIERLLSYPSQRGEALKARTAVIAREAGASANLARLDNIVDRLPEGSKGYLAGAPRVREMVAGIAEAQRRLDSVDRPFLRQPYAEALVSKIEAFHGQISGFREPLASEFRKAADAWLKRAQAQLEHIKTITGRKPPPQVFRAGDPVDRSQEAFVPRMGAIGQVERQIVLATGCPGLLIYGRRRMGKSTLIRNLDAFVPDVVRIVSVSMQDPKLFSSTAHFVRLIDEKLDVALNDESAALKSDDLGNLFKRLTRANSRLDDAGLRLILAIDEFENIDTKIGEGVFSTDLLATIRESIQSHRRLIWVFAGSHRVTMLKNAEWPSYLISVQTIEIPPFTEAETRLLLTDPLQRSPLYARNAERRPRFESSFWGEGGITWIHAQTAGWPHLVQLLASGAVDFANESETARLDARALEEVARRATVSGDMVLHQLVHGESQSDAERAYIAGFRTRDSQPPPDDEATFQSLRHREIIAEDGGVWRLKVPLMQQWLRTRG